jgi:hypothetical protein
MNMLSVCKEIDRLQLLAIDQRVSEDKRRDAIERLESWEAEIRRWAAVAEFRH